MGLMCLEHCLHSSQVSLRQDISKGALPTDKEYVTHPRDDMSTSKPCPLAQQLRSYVIRDPAQGLLPLLVLLDFGCPSESPSFASRS